ncbi:hypothetical protein ACTXT7_005388 [Hymenolepis weldensis]
MHPSHVHALPHPSKLFVVPSKALQSKKTWKAESSAEISSVPAEPANYKRRMSTSMSMRGKSNILSVFSQDYASSGGLFAQQPRG